MSNNYIVACKYNYSNEKSINFMNALIFSLNATIPVFLVILLGGLLQRIGLFPRSICSAIDKYVFRIALPFMLFQDISSMDLQTDADPAFALFCALGTCVMFLGTWGMTVLLCRDKKIRGAFVQASARGSAAILGIAFVNNIYGNSGYAPFMIMCAVPLFNIFSVIILTIHARESTEETAKSQGLLLKKTLRGIITNPIILGILAGVPFALLHLELPQILLSAVSSVGKTATPMALLSIGAAFEGKKALTKIRPTILASAMKLCILPALFLPVAIWSGFRGSELVAVLVMTGSPTTISCYIMAKNMGNDAELTASIVVATSLISSLTLTLWIFLLRSLWMI